MKESRSPICKHVLDAAIILRQNILLDFLLGEPLEIAEVLRVGLEISLSSQNAAFHEESLLARDKLLGVFVGLRRLEYSRVVANWMEADKPSVHVDTCRLGKGTLSGLKICYQPFSSRQDLP